MRPPLALVLYDAKDIDRASYYPFARFSPEYQAIEWAVAQGVAVRPIDLPARHYLALKEAGARHDPLVRVAELTGYPDAESWWDATVERGSGDPEATFAALLDVVTELRSSGKIADPENDRREAYMRVQIRKAMKEPYERIAIVVGAWHGPALVDPGRYKATADRALLRGLPKVKVSQAWVPWSFPRLSRMGGYGAGVVSPAWYAMLFNFPDNAVSRWMAAAAQLLRSEGFEASPALATEAVALAETLANLRGYERPGIGELEEAVLTTLASGHPERLALIHQRLTVGETVGSVPPDIATVPLLDDLRREIKGTRLTKFWEQGGEHYLKATKQKPRGSIDLRQANDLRKSYLLHRLNLLGIAWGRLQPVGPDAISSFREIWLLEWQPEFSLAILERSSYGATLVAATTAYVQERASELPTVTPLARLILDVLRAALPDLVPDLLQLLRERAAATTDVGSLLEVLPALVQTSRYGDSRKTDTTAVLLVIDELLPRLAAGLPTAATNIDEEQANSLLKQLAAANYQLGQLGNSALDEIWLAGLDRTARADAHPTVVGYCTRLLYDRGALRAEEAARRFSRALSTANGAQSVADWVGGFLHGSGQLLLHYPRLFELVDNWVAGLAWSDFERVVPQLRRTFSDFSRYDRQKLMALTSQADQQEKPADEATQENVKTSPLIEKLLQWM